jgi:hypothetical protein
MTTLFVREAEPDAQHAADTCAVGAEVGGVVGDDFGVLADHHEALVSRYEPHVTDFDGGR